MSFFISDALAATPAIQQPGMEGLLFPAGILVFFYFLFLRPQAQRSKEKKQMIAAMGKVVDLDDNFVKLEVGDNIFIQVQRQSIESMMPKGTYKAVTKKANS
jgi:preprotein translocase subunit YajC